MGRKPSKVEQDEGKLMAHWYKKEYKGQIIDELHLTFDKNSQVLLGFKYFYFPPLGMHA